MIECMTAVIFTKFKQYLFYHYGKESSFRKKVPYRMQIKFKTLLPKYTKIY